MKNSDSHSKNQTLFDVCMSTGVCVEREREREREIEEEDLIWWAWSCGDHVRQRICKMVDLTTLNRRYLRWQTCASRQVWVKGYNRAQFEWDNCYNATGSTCFFKTHTLWHLVGLNTLYVLTLEKIMMPMSCPSKTLKDNVESLCLRLYVNMCFSKEKSSVRRRQVLGFGCVWQCGEWNVGLYSVFPWIRECSGGEHKNSPSHPAS